MPKDRRVNSFSFKKSRTSPYTSISKNSDLNSQKSLPKVVNETEWEEARCPICMEHPHNAVLLLFSSRDKGCQPYMCNTSNRHSNCLDQFCKSCTVGAQQHKGNVSGAVFRRGSGGKHFQEQQGLMCNSNLSLPALFARDMSKLRMDCCKGCMNIPYESPSDANPMRQSEWTRLERQRDFEDAFSANQAPCGDDFLTELSLDSGLFDLLDGYSEAVEGCDEDVNMSLDFEFELSFLSEFPLVPHWFLRHGMRLQAMLVGGAPIDQRVVLDHKTGDLEDWHHVLITTNEGLQVQEAQIYLHTVI
ncbi:hypothetical protein CQW23_28550 [Capsicum baccatum]|uniref:Uncharacterized protein n=1 Tax=Capsicum baccatum TaxID=33114 RepID=A0A2G2VGX2_CAPBA|nr:hypothetical protein CQW23_28550 [Capsicum baccatum]